MNGEVALMAGLQVVDAEGKAKANRILAELDDLAPLPQVVTKALELIHDSSSNARELSQVLSLDQALAAKMLSLANSAYHGMPRRVTTITEAVVRLGYNSIKGLLITASVAGMLQKKVPGYGLEQGSLWQHSISTAIGSRLIAQRLRHGRAEEAYIVGLLHDVGKIILDRVMRKDFALVLKRVSEEQVPFSTAEREIFGFDHAYIGGLVAQKWCLPDHFADAIAHHHCPSEAVVEKDIAAIVHVADVVSMMLGIGIGGDGLYYQADASAVSSLHLEAQDIEQLMSDLAQFTADVQLFLMVGGEGVGHKKRQKGT